MKKLLITLPLLITIYSPIASHNLDSLLVALDHTIQEQSIYVEIRESRIDNLKRKLAQNKNEYESIYSLNKQLYEEYKAFICDSAIHYLNNNYDLAIKTNNLYWKDESSLLLSYRLSSSGMYMESLKWLLSVNKRTLDKNLYPEYYSCYEHLYNELSLNTHDHINEPEYRRLARAYKDSLLLVLDPASEEYLGIKEIIYLDNGELEKAEDMNNQRLKDIPAGTPEHALIAFWRALLFREKQDTEEYKIWLTLSALSDVKSAIKDNASICMLADILYEEGDIDRAYTYIRQSLDDANYYNARLRSFQIASIQSVIDKTYQAKSEQQKAKLRNYLIMISILFVLLLIALVYIYRQMKKLSVTRNNLQLANGQLNDLNKELHLMNGQLQNINMELSESNHIKEEYIGHFLTLCSAYIDKLESYRRMVSKRITTGQIPELLKATKSSEFMETELAGFYANFDKTFLHIYPSFVEEFNSLLVDNEKIVLKKGELLNTELRIFALIRLGIEDSSKIAKLLRYSVNTIYNYRAKVKNKAKGSREDFETLIMKIGTFPA